MIHREFGVKLPHCEQKYLVIESRVLYNENRTIQNSTIFYKRDVTIVAKHTIRILNYNLTLTSDDDKSYIENVAERVERNIKTLSDAMPTRNMTEVALFVAMDYCDRYMKSINDGTQMRGQIKDYLKDAGFVRKQLEEAKKENELLKEENEKLRARLSGDAPAPQPAIDDDDDDDQPVKTELTLDLTPAAEPEQPVIPPRPMPTVKQEKTEKPAKDILFGRKKSSKKKKESKPTPPVRGVWGADAFSESADAAADIMSFFEEKSFEDDDD